MRDGRDLTYLLRDPDALRSSLKDADPGTLVLVLVQLTQDTHWLDIVRPHIHGPMNYHEKMPEELRERIRSELFDALMDFARTGKPLPSLPNDTVMHDMLSVASGEENISDKYHAMMREEFTLDSDEPDPRGLNWRNKPAQSVLDAGKVVIVGAGVSGLCIAIRLQEAGIPFVIIEKNSTVGGTWFENSYPGCGVDVPNHFYSFSFAPNHDWSHVFAKREEIWKYLEDITHKYDLRRHIFFDTEVTSAHYGDDGRWHVSATSKDGTERKFDAKFFVTAVGLLNRPKTPDIPGLENFEGPAFHSAQWDHSFDWRGKRVGIIGTGASALQVGPSIAPDVEKLMIFQRSPGWIVPNPNYHAAVPEGMKWVLKNVPYYHRWLRFQLAWAFSDGLYPALQVDPDWPDPERSLNAINERHRKFMINHMKSELSDRPDLLEKVTPNYPPYGKRILIDNDWFKMLKRENVDLITDAVDRVLPDGVKMKDGTVWKADALAFATGFHVSRFLWPMNIYGKNGLEIHEKWGSDDATAYLGTAVPGFPNMFMLAGPNTATGHGGNQIYISECQIRYVLLAIREVLERNATSIECRKTIHDSYNAKVDAEHKKMVWTHPSMTNWYRNAKGRIFALAPWRLVEFWKLTSKFKPKDYEISQ